MAALDRVSEPTLNFPAAFLKNMATSLMHAGTTINGVPSTLLPLWKDVGTKGY